MRWEITKHRVVRAVGISAWVLVASLAAAVRADDVGPTIEVWYGPNQTFGSPGMAQRWVNVLGNVSDPDGISSLTFSLNGGPQQDLSVGPDRRRLWEDGDFNVEIDFADLNDGANNVLITATDRTGRVSTRDVVVNFPSGQLWPLPFNVDWSNVSDLQSVAQVVDGEWTLEAAALRTPPMGYDRVIAFGDAGWTSYEVTATITLLDLDPAGYQWPSVSPGFGITLRWPGHSDNPVVCPQPHCGWLPAGGGFWYDAGNDGPLALWGDLGFYRTRGLTIPYDAPHVFRIRVQDNPNGGSDYAVKVWPAGAPEPGDWDLTGTEPPGDVPGGAFILIAHHVDLRVGDVNVVPLGDPADPVISNVQVAVAGDQATVSWNTDSITTGAVAYGPTDAYEDGTVASPAADSAHSVVLANLVGGLEYHYQITATDAVGGTTTTADATFIAALPDNDPPVISDVQVTPGDTSAVVTWTTDEPATSFAEYGLTGSFGDSVSSAALTTNHQLMIPNLAPETTYVFAVASTDAAGNTATAPGGTFATTAPAPTVLVSDEFDGLALDPAVWTFVNPFGDAAVSMTGSQVSIDIPDTPNDHEIWITGNTAPRILQTVADVDFEFEVKFDSPLVEEIQIQGVVVEENPDRVVRIEFFQLGGQTYFYVASIFDGGFTNHRVETLAISPPMYIRVNRNGDTFTVSRSDDGVNYATRAVFNQPMAVSAVGIHAGSTEGLAHSAVADFFLDTSEPPAFTDCNNNGIDDADDIAAGAADCNANGVPDECESGADCNANGVPDVCELDDDCNANGVPDECELDEDCNANGVPDVCELDADCDANGVPDTCQPDSDADGVIDACDACPDDAAKTDPGICGCGTADDDGDGDGVPDCNDNCAETSNADQADCDADGVGDACAGDPDCNANGVPDACDIAEGTSSDTDADGVPDECTVEPGLRFETGVTTATMNHATVQLANQYDSPVVVCTLNDFQAGRPVVIRVSNVTATSFDLRLQNPSGRSVNPAVVSYIVMEEGAWTIDGVACEARRYLSTRTDENARWWGERQHYLQDYANPVVIGQVMSENDSRWSVFWCRGSRRYRPPSPNRLYTGKTVCEDRDENRADETIGYIVFEGGPATLGGVAFEARLGGDSIRGVGNRPPYDYTFSVPFANPPQVNLATQAGMDGNNGGWAYTYGQSVTTNAISLVIDEDQRRDWERRHTTEQVGYVVFESPVVYP
jgi:hypothetical protein